MDAKRLALVVPLVLLLGGCGGNENTDPRQGRVEISHEGCFTGGCYTDWKACAGPDLITHIAGKDYTITDSPECAR